MRDLRQQFGLPLTMDGTVASHQPKARAAGVIRPAPADELPSADRADALFLRESLRAKSNQQRTPVEPFSAAWFEAAQRQRHDRQAPWLPRLLEFHRHEGEAVLALGNGLGSDWLEYAKNGSNVTVCCADAEQSDLVRLNFELRDLPSCIRQIDFPVLPLADDSFDVACVLSLPAEREAETVAEVYRVLRPGGKILAVLPARRNAVWWQRVLLPWSRLVPSCAATSTFSQSTGFTNAT